MKYDKGIVADLGKIHLAHIHAVEETIRYIEDNKKITYDGLIKHLDWYWKGSNSFKPQAWMFDWVRCLTE